MSALTLTLRTSPARYAALPLSLIGIAVLFIRTDYWMGIWPEAGAAAQTAGYFISLFAAGVAGWAAAAPSKNGMDEQFAAAKVPGTTIEAARLGAALIWVAAPYGLTVAGAVIATVASDGFPSGFPMFLSYTLIGLVPIALGTAWGWLVGRAFPPMVAAVSALLSWLIVSYLLLVFADGVVTVSGPPWIAVDSGLVALRLGAAVLLALAVCMLPRLKRRIAVPAAAIAVSLIAVGASFSTTVLYDRAVPADEDLVCYTGEIEYCLWPEHEKYLELVETVDANAAELPGVVELPERMVDYRLSGEELYWMEMGPEGDVDKEFDSEFDISEGSVWALAMGVSDGIQRVTFEGCDRDLYDDPELGPAIEQFGAWLEYRLAGGGSVDYTTTAPRDIQEAWAEGREIAAEWPEAEQTAWVEDLLDRAKVEYC
ncbi:hypothetical protein [Glycomyces salinus]|uniref:hypothetical protein n=1 Tax=Glycomyces salinus TaxID=980294 RepID=UPI0018EBE68F|nr:hypothetical protein [Glycomyces salinus]